jgi:ferritin
MLGSPMMLFQLPPHEAFYSTLKNENISAEDYQLCQTVWEDNDMRTMKEFLTWYYNKDVEPMIFCIILQRYRALASTP